MANKQLMNAINNAYDVGYRKAMQDSCEPMITWMVMSMMSVSGIGNKRIIDAMSKFVHYVNLNSRDADSILEMQKQIKRVVGIDIRFVFGKGESEVIDEDMNHWLTEGDFDV